MGRLQLPVANEYGYYEMRFESVGGLGANLAGQVLAEAAVLGMGYNGAHFSSYGSEKKGSPVKSFVRLCPPENELRTSSPVTRPHLLAIFHHCLLKVDGTTDGVYPESIIVVNSPDQPHEVGLRSGLASGKLYAVDALTIAVEFGTRINTAMLGAVVRAAEFLDPLAVKTAIAESFKGKPPEQIEQNLKTFDEGYDRVKIIKLPAEGATGSEPGERHIAGVHTIGYDNAPMGGTIVNPGNSDHKDLSASRQGIFPLFHRDRCIDCGLCTMTCPDFVFVWRKGLDKYGRPAMVLDGPNLQYCKGCLKCVEICPVQALTTECEKPEFKYTADVQLWGPPDALIAMSRENRPAKWDKNEGYYWYRVG